MMPAHAVTLKLPESLYDQLRRQAAEARRSLEAELLDVVSTAVFQKEELSADLSQILSGLQILDDEALWLAARLTLPDKVTERFAELNHQAQRRDLTEIEKAELPGLIAEYDRHMLVRARAASLLKQRGHDVDSLPTRTPLPRQKASSSGERAEGLPSLSR